MKTSVRNLFKSVICWFFIKLRGEIMSEILVVQSKVKEEIGKADMNCSGDLAEALSVVVEHKIKRAIERAKANGRKTVRPEDL